MWKDLSIPHLAWADNRGPVVYQLWLNVVGSGVNLPTQIPLIWMSQAWEARLAKLTRKQK